MTNAHGLISPARAKKLFQAIQRLKWHTSVRARYLINRHLWGLSVSEPPIFIVGCGHSGTSLLLAILGSHSRLCAIPFESSIAFRDDVQLESMARSFDRYAIAKRKSGWIEKTPRHVRKIDELRNRFDSARFVLVLRDGRDVAVSLKERRGSIESGIRLWLNDNLAGEPFWNEPFVHVVRYEDLVTRTRETVKETVSFLGLPFEESLLEYYKEPKHYYWPAFLKSNKGGSKNHEQHRNWQINQPVFDGRGRWLKDMTEGDKSLFKDQAGDMLIRYGYARDDNW